jgi:hypothetical protein
MFDNPGHGEGRSPRFLSIPHVGKGSLGLICPTAQCRPTGSLPPCHQALVRLLWPMSSLTWSRRLVADGRRVRRGARSGARLGARRCHQPWRVTRVDER